MVVGKGKGREVHSSIYRQAGRQWCGDIREAVKGAGLL